MGSDWLLWCLTHKHIHTVLGWDRTITRALSCVSLAAFLSLCSFLLLFLPLSMDFYGQHVTRSLSELIYLMRFGRMYNEFRRRGGEGKEPDKWRKRIWDGTCREKNCYIRYITDSFLYLLILLIYAKFAERLVTI